MFSYAVYGLVIDPGSLPLAWAMAWPPTWLWVPGVALALVFVPLYFPNGRLLSPRWRPALWLALFLSVTLAVLGAFAPGATRGERGVTNPLGIEALRPVAGTLGDIVTGVLSLVVFLAALVFHAIIGTGNNNWVLRSLLKRASKALPGVPATL